MLLQRLNRREAFGEGKICSRAGGQNWDNLLKKAMAVIVDSK